MARRARLVVPHFPHHVTQRGNRRQEVFFGEDDYRCYLSLLAKYCRAAATEIWAYCLMPNHVHLIMVPTREDGLKAVFREVHGRYTRRINQRNEWCGHLWQGRFYSVVMDERHMLSAVRYVERNPVSAGLCSKAEEWPWSSAGAHLQGRDDDIVRVGPLLALVPDWRDYLATSVSDEQRRLLQQHTRTGRPLGDDSFIERLENLTGRTLKPRRRRR